MGSLSWLFVWWKFTVAVIHVRKVRLFGLALAMTTWY